MSGPTDLEEKAILDARLDRVGALFLGLFLVMPADDGTGGTEVANAFGYARVAINPSVTQWAAADATTAPTVKKGPTGAYTWVFPNPSGGNWGDTVGIGIWDSGTYGAGNLLWTSQYAGAIVVTINNGDPPLTFDSTHQITAQCGDPTDPFT